jgi:arginase
VLDYRIFRSTHFNRPDVDFRVFDGIAKGELAINDVLRLINEVDQLTEIVGLGITEYLPWDALNLRLMLKQLPLLRNE